MKNFSLFQPTRIHFGEGQIQQIRKEVANHQNVLFIYGGGSIKKNTIYDQCIEALEGKTVVEYSGVSPNPKYEQLMEAAEVVRSRSIDFILAVGGGSVIDGAKFVAAAAKLDVEPWGLFTGKAKLQDVVPMGCVLTLPATGSESNGGTVVTRDKDKMAFVHDALRPKFAVMDPAATLTLPTEQVANGVVDAFVHVVEQYVTQTLETKHPIANKVHDRFAEGLLMTLIEEGLHVKNHPQDMATRKNIMWAANQALNGLIGAGVPQDWATHMIGHELTALFGIDHARSLSIILPALWKVRKQEKSEKLLQYAERVWGVVDGSVDERLDAAIHKTEEFFVEMGVPIRLSDVGLDSTAVDAVIEQLNLHGLHAMGEDGQITLDVSREILKLALD